MATHDFDLFVIGGGSGGVRAARVASQLGKKVAIAEEYRYGGTCVIRGCVPKKLLVYASHFREDFEDAVAYGWNAEVPDFDWQTLIANKDAEIDRLNGVYLKLLDGAGVEIMNGRATLVDAHTVAVGETTVTAETILIAVGAQPFVPDIPGAAHAITSNEAFHLEALPKRVLVVGGGYIAVEFAGIFHGLGSQTTLMYRGPKILRGFDEDVRDAVQEAYVAGGVDVRTDEDIAGIEKVGDGLLVGLKSGGTLAVDAVMYATGRLPYTQGLGLEAAGVATGKKGEIVVDAYSKTSVDNIYAVGDVTDRMNLTPVAIREGQAFANTLYGGTPTAVDHGNIPTAVFSQPPVGTVGLTEAEATERHDNVDVYLARFRPMRHTLSGRQERILMKLIVDADTDKVLGVHMVGPDAAEIIQALGIAVKMGATKADFDATVAVHPTAAEEFVTMREPTTKHRKRDAA